MAKKRMTESEANIIAAIDFILDQMEGNHRFVSYPIPEELVETLNDRKLPEAGRKRLKRILQLLKRRQEAISRVSSDPNNVKLSAAFIEGFVRDADALNEVLLRYKVSPRIDLYATTPRVSYRPCDSIRDSKKEDAESSAVMRLLQLAERDELDPVRECMCGRFFLAARIDQRHCSAACRVKAHQSSEEFKAKRRKADRERYRLHKQGAVKQSNRRKNGTQKAR